LIFKKEETVKTKMNQRTKGFCDAKEAINPKISFYFFNFAALGTKFSKDAKIFNA